MSKPLSPELKISEHPDDSSSFPAVQVSPQVDLYNSLSKVINNRTQNFRSPMLPGSNVDIQTSSGDVADIQREPIVSSGGSPSFRSRSVRSDGAG